MDIFFDATDIEQGSNLLELIEYTSEEICFVSDIYDILKKSNTVKKFLDLPTNDRALVTFKSILKKIIGEVK